MDVASQVSTVLLELGCVVHSAAMGMAVGVSSLDDDRLAALVAALLLHQVLEAITLGSMVGGARFSCRTGASGGLLDDSCKPSWAPEHTQEVFACAAYFGS
jgi:hypothetical protein